MTTEERNAEIDRRDFKRIEAEIITLREQRDSFAQEAKEATELNMSLLAVLKMLKSEAWNVTVQQLLYRGSPVLSAVNDTIRLAEKSLGIQNEVEGQSG